MILSATIHGGYRRGTTTAQIDALITEIMTTLDGGDPWTYTDCGETASLYFAEEPLTAETFAEPPFTWSATHELVVSVNRATGFGTLRWDTEFVSTNPTPPGSPAVIGDPYVPYWYHPRYAIPLPQVALAIREFCAAQGARPANVAWSDDGAHHERLYLSTDEYRNIAIRSAEPTKDTR